MGARDRQHEVENGEPLLSVRNLRTTFATRDVAVEAVRGVDLDLYPGNKVAIVGESGSGKSALALSIAGLIESPGRVQGEVWFKGKRISEGTESELTALRAKNLGLIFQNPGAALNPVKTIGEQLVERIRADRPELKRREARDRAVELLEAVEISRAAARLHDYPHQYSGGMQQRVWIAIAIANEPDLLIADEPTTALDVTTQSQVLELLDRLVSERGVAIVFITHNLGIVAEFCEDVYVMYAGRVVERTDRNRVFKYPVHPYTEGLLKSVPRIDKVQSGSLASIPGSPPDPGESFRGCSFEPRCAVGQGEHICQVTRPVPGERIGGERLDWVVQCHFARTRLEAFVREIQKRKHSGEAENRAG